MTNLHTQGPWFVESGAVYARISETNKKNFHGAKFNIGTVIPISSMNREAGNGTLPVERDANAHLIASAPDLLLALRLVIQEDVQGDINLSNELRTQILEVMKRAGQ